MTYRAPWDTAVKFVTAGVVCLLSVMAVWYWLREAFPLWLKIAVTVLFLFILIAAWMYRPVKYVVDEGNLVIERPVRSKIISLRSIVSIRRVKNAELGTLIRMWGSGGLFGYYGKFRSTRMGRMTLYATNRANRVLIETDDGDLILISPEHPERFINDLAVRN